MFTEITTDVFVAEGPTVPFYKVPYPTRMVVIRLSDTLFGRHLRENSSVHAAWVWSPTALSQEIAQEIEDKIGEVKYIVSPNKLHHIYLREWAEKYPDATIYLPPGLRGRKVLSDKLRNSDRVVDLDEKMLPSKHSGMPPDSLREEEKENESAIPKWSKEIEYVTFWGSLFMDEVVFFHKASRTVLFCDLIQRHTDDTNPELAKSAWWKKAAMQLDGLCGLDGSTPREWRASFWRREPARVAREKVLKEWNPDTLVIAHGECAKTGAAPIVAKALSWM